MKVIMVSGKAESGKNYVAALIHSLLGENVLEIAFGDYLKFICKSYLGWNGNKDEQGRNLLQHIGTDVCRGFYEDFFVDKVIELLHIFPSRWKYVLITDLRFKNEYYRVAENFKTISVRVNRPGFENHLTEEQKCNPSETELDNFVFDYYIVNDSSVEEQVKCLVEVINGN